MSKAETGGQIDTPDFSRFEGLPTLFANVGRAAVAEHLLQFATVPPTPFTVDQAVRAFDGSIPTSSVARALKGLEDLGMVGVQESPSYDRRKHLLPDSEHPYWAVVASVSSATQ